MALAWENLDDLDDEDLWWAALAAEPPLGSPPGILEQVAAQRAAWHAQAACRDHPELDWFAAADQDATEAVCATCPAAGPCGDAGRREGYGVWGGQAHRMGGTGRGLQPVADHPAPEPERVVSGRRLHPFPCVDCGEVGTYCLRRCPRCYGAHWRRRQDVPERPKGRRIGVCVECGQERQMQGRDGQCRWCYTRAVYYRQKAQRAQATS